MPLVDTIAESDFLGNIPESLLQRFEELAHPEHYAPGAVLYVEGLEHPEFHIVVEGHVRLEMLIPHRGQVPIMTCGPGDILAWSTLLGEPYMTTTAVALDSVKTLAFRGTKLRTLCETEFEIGYHIMRQLSKALSRRLTAVQVQSLAPFAEQLTETDLHRGFERRTDISV